MRTDGTAVGYLEERGLDLAWKLAASAAIALVLVGCYCNKHIGRGLEPRARHLPRCRAYPPRLRVHHRSRPLSRLPRHRSKRAGLKQCWSTRCDHGLSTISHSSTKRSEAAVYTDAIVLE